MMDSKSLQSSRSFSGSRTSDDGLPTYDDIDHTVIYIPGQSTSSGSQLHAEDYQSSRKPEHLFSGPPNAESLDLDPSFSMLQFERKVKFWKIWYSDAIATMDVIGVDSWDDKLADPGVLLNYVKFHASREPKMQLRCWGTRQEIASTDGALTVNGQSLTTKKGEAYTVTDFHFFINMSDLVAQAESHLFVVPGWRPAHRGTHIPAYGASLTIPHGIDTRYHALPEITNDEYRGATSGILCTRAEEAKFRLDNKARWSAGFPIWAKPPGSRASIRPDDPELGSLEEQPASLEEWCEAYCADEGWMKEFKMMKEVWGWDFDSLFKKIKEDIKSTGNCVSTDIHVGLDIFDTQVVIRPNNIWTRATNHKFIFVILCITLIYPIIWLLDRTGLLPSGGGKYDIARTAYSLKSFIPLPSTFPGKTIPEAKTRLPGMIKYHPQLPLDPLLQLGPKGVYYLRGKREGAWLREWEDRIKMGVRMKYKGDLKDIMSDDTQTEVRLDGY